jgi:NAD(P)-dependent dehydrogenase (short-subunit alcohol dehydrogenase family)
MELTNASALVTGGAGGLGSATARRLAQRGAKVVIADVDDARGAALAREIGQGSVFVHTDILNEASIANAVAVAVGLGPLRAAVVAHGAPAGAGPRRPGYQQGRKAPVVTSKSSRPAAKRLSIPMSSTIDPGRISGPSPTRSRLSNWLRGHA